MRKSKERSVKESGSRALILTLLLVFAVGIGRAQQPPPSGQTPSKAGAGQTPSKSGGSSIVVGFGGARDDRYRIGPGDLLAISVFDYPQLATEIRVDSRGTIVLPMIEGEVQASCRTEVQLAREIGVRYLKYLKEPQVRVAVTDYQSQPVAVLGAVNSPGRFQLQRRLRLLELLTYVNGPATGAGRSIQIIHTGSAPCEVSPNGAEQSNGTEVAEQANGTEQPLEYAFETLSLSEALRGVERANPFVQPGDIITVPEAETYYLMGNVAKPAAYPIKEPVTLTQAIVIAGGTLPDSQTSKIRIIRQAGPGAPKTELLCDLKAIAKEQSREVMLQANDIIEVPKKGGATMAVKTWLKTMLPMVTNMPMRVILPY
jgi:polysaccharide biosynthesis/export protein